MDQVKKIESKNIQFEYEKDALPDDKLERSMIHNVNTWLSPYVDEINNQLGVIKILIMKDKTTRLHLDQMEDALMDTLHKQLERFRPGHNR